MNTEKPKHPMYYFNKLRQMNPGACKNRDGTKNEEGLSALMKEARLTARISDVMRIVHSFANAYARIYYPTNKIRI